MDKKNPFIFSNLMDEAEKFTIHSVVSTRAEVQRATRAESKPHYIKPD